LVHELLNRNSELVTKVDTLVSQNAQLAQQVQELTALLVAHDAEPTTDV
jgi:DNA anti-recombination protein RmuC